MESGRLFRRGAASEEATIRAPRRALDAHARPWAAAAIEIALSPLMGRFVASVGEYVFVTSCMIPNAIWVRLHRWPANQGAVPNSKVARRLGSLKPYH